MPGSETGVLLAEQLANALGTKVNSLGFRNDGVLIQKYLCGTEYVIDTVNRNGQHQIVSLWAYDKREVNGRYAKNCYSNYCTAICQMVDEREALHELRFEKVVRQNLDTRLLRN